MTHLPFPPPPAQALQHIGEIAGKLLDKLPLPPAPEWLVHEGQHRLVLLLNHIVMQEPIAQQRLRSQQGKTLQIQWQQYKLPLCITAAGLFDLASTPGAAHLQVRIDEPSAWHLAKAATQGSKPTIHIEGDVHLAAEVAWLADNLRWDVEEDLARIVGDVPAHTLAHMARSALQAIRRFTSGNVPSPSTTASL